MVPKNSKIKIKKSDPKTKCEYKQIKKKCLDLLDEAEADDSSFLKGKQREIHDDLFGTKAESPYDHRSVSNVINNISKKYNDGTLSSGMFDLLVITSILLPFSPFSLHIPDTSDYDTDDDPNLKHLRSKMSGFNFDSPKKKKESAGFFYDAECTTPSPLPPSPSPFSQDSLIRVFERDVISCHGIREKLAECHIATISGCSNPKVTLDNTKNFLVVTDTIEEMFIPMFLAGERGHDVTLLKDIDFQIRSERIEKAAENIRTKKLPLKARRILKIFKNVTDRIKPGEEGVVTYISCVVLLDWDDPDIDMKKKGKFLLDIWS